MICWVIMSFHLWMAHFLEILDPYMAESYAHGRPSYENRKVVKSDIYLGRLGHNVFSSKDGTF